ncbi:MAG TPA: intein-containing Rv2578c family radical SAM protein [Pseudonocardia sp.]|nr:intein-containing Rv2578c family radical SAM protein [Pseudonocardia sp.]
MRWSRQDVQDDGVGAASALPGLRGLLRSVRTPEFAGTVFHEVEAKSALNRVPGSSPVPFRWTVNPYRGCSHACVYCLGGDTRVLLADGRTRPIAELRVGDVVLGTQVVDGCRRYVPTTVRAHWSTVKPAHRVRLANGAELVASGEHRFLAADGWRHVRGGWCRAGRRRRLRAGSGLLGPGRFGPQAQPTPAYRRGYLCGLIRADDAAAPGRSFPSTRLGLEALGRVHHYLAALAERLPLPVGGGPAGPGRIGPLPAASTGDGTTIADALRWPEQAGSDWCRGFLAGVVDSCGVTVRGQLRIRHPDDEIVGRVAGACHRLGYRFEVESEQLAGGGRTPSVRLLGGAPELLRFQHEVDPAGHRPRDLSGAPVTGGSALTVESIVPAGVQRLYDITTDTGDFVAEGVISHNCFARNTHTYLELDAGADFDSQIVVKVNIARVLDRELRAPRWTREPVAMGTNTDPYQRAEGRYRLMPGVIGALARSGTPFSLLTKGTVLARDLPALVAAAADVPVRLGVSIALLDRQLQAGLEPGTPSPAARLELVRRIRGAGLRCGVMVAPVLPLLTDSTEQLDALLGRIAAAGADGATVLALHLRPGTREWFLGWLTREHPDLIEPYAGLYRRGAYVVPEYRHALAERIAPLLRRHGLSSGADNRSDPGAHTPQPPEPRPEQLSLL